MSDILPFALLNSKSPQLWERLSVDERNTIFEYFLKHLLYDTNTCLSFLEQNSHIKQKMREASGVNQQALYDIQQLVQSQNYAPVQGMSNPSNQCWFDAPVFVLLADPTGWFLDRILTNHNAHPALSEGLRRIHDFMYGKRDYVNVIDIIEKGNILNEAQNKKASGYEQNNAITLVLNVNGFLCDYKIKLVSSRIDIDEDFHENILFIDSQTIESSAGLIGLEYIQYGEVYWVYGNHYTAALRLDEEKWLFYDDKGVYYDVKGVDNKIERVYKIERVEQQNSFDYRYENPNVCITTYNAIQNYLLGKDPKKTYLVYCRVDSQTQSFPYGSAGETKSPPRRLPQSPAGETKSPPQSPPQSPTDETAVPTLATLVTRFGEFQEKEERQWRRDYNKLLDYLSHDERAEFILNQLLLRGIERNSKLEKELEERQRKLFSAQSAEFKRVQDRPSGVYDGDIQYKHDSLPPFEHVMIYDMSANLVFEGSLRVDTPELDENKAYELFQGARIKSFDRLKFIYGHHFKHALPAIANIFQNANSSAPPDTEYVKKFLYSRLAPVMDIEQLAGRMQTLDTNQKETLARVYHDLKPLGDISAAQLVYELVEHMDNDF